MKFYELTNLVIPEQAGIQKMQQFWMPACADGRDRFAPLHFVRNGRGCGWYALAAVLSGREK